MKGGRLTGETQPMLQAAASKIWRSSDMWFWRCTQRQAHMLNAILHFHSRAK